MGTLGLEGWASSLGTLWYHSISPEREAPLRREGLLSDVITEGESSNYSSEATWCRQSH